MVRETVPKSSGQAKRTMYHLGMDEPGTQRFLEERETSGSNASTRHQYVEMIGSIRVLAGKPLLDLSKDELRALDRKLLDRAKIFRTILKMYLRDNERDDLDKVLRRQRRPEKRKPGLEEVLTPDDLMSLIGVADDKRDRAILAVLGTSGCRINECLELRLRDIKPVNGSGYQFWFGRTKVRGHERAGRRMDGVFKEIFDKYLRGRQSQAPNDKDAFLFPSSDDVNTHVTSGTIEALLRALAKKAGLTKHTNPHWIRHSVISVAFLNREADLATMSIWFWGVPVTASANRYVHFQGLDMRIEPATERELPDVPSMPTPPILGTLAKVADLTVKLERLEGVARFLAEWEPDASHCAKCGVGIIRWTPTRKYCDACTLAMAVPVVDEDDVQRGLARMEGSKKS